MTTMNEHRKYRTGPYSDKRNRTLTWWCSACRVHFTRTDGSHCPDCGECDQEWGHLDCRYPSGGPS